ncbi:MAG: glycogen debranching N-terminal domain-containing protein [Candidatus Limnocylindrales bacterium]
MRTLPAHEPEIVHATDLGGVQVLKHGGLYLLTDGFGDIHPDTRGLGLYLGDTRIVSCLALRINGVRPVLLRADTGANYRGTIQLTNSDYSPDQSRKVDPSLALARQSLGITRDRVLAAGLDERIRIANFSPHPEDLTIELLVDVDAADIFEVRGRHRPERGTMLPIAVRDDGRVTFAYAGLDGSTRRTYVEAAAPDTIAASDEREGAVVLRWRRRLPPGGDTTLGWTIWSGISATVASAGGRAAAGGNGVEPDGAVEFPSAPPVDPELGAQAYRAWTEHSAVLDSDNELFDLAIRRSLSDLRLLTNEGPDPGERYVAAGVPWYSTLFGRDALITGFQALAFRPAIAVEALDVLAARQATTVDDWRDAQPGKILHELRTGEMARARELPHTPYYGSVDSTPLWLILLAATYDWTGDRGLVDRHWPTALAALRWIDEYGTGPDGFVTYERRSPQGLVNQGWKDSGDAVRDRTGATIEPPIALAEVQGYVFDAKRRMAGLARSRGEDGLATRLDAESEELRRRFELAFWEPDLRYYVMAIGRDGRRADAIASNPGQCLWSGIVDPARASDVVARLTGDQLDSGWGIRTYGSGQPGYNPIGYHTGSVWPHDNALIVDGLKEYGFHDVANLFVGRIFEATQHFADFRLPELFCGFARTEVDVPVPYPVACSPQAWAAGSPLLFLRSMLGMRARAERRELELVRPHLPPWLGKVTIGNLRVGDASVDLLFHRWRGTTSAEVLRKHGDLAVTIRM